MSQPAADNRVVLITGAGRGIGQAAAFELGRRGATVFGTEMTATGAAEVTAAFAARGIRGRGMVLDVRDAPAITRLVAEVQEASGSITVLVNNAGNNRNNLLLRMSDEEWDDVLSVNLKSVFHLSRACLPGMVRAGIGRIINIASIVGAVGNAGQANYAAAKAGMMGFTRSLALEVAASNITVNAVAPGIIDTDMTRATLGDRREALRRSIPMQRIGLPEDVAPVIAFLASVDAGYITGQTLHVNGGLYMP